MSEATFTALIPLSKIGDITCQVILILQQSINGNILPFTLPDHQIREITISLQIVKGHS